VTDSEACGGYDELTALLRTTRQLAKLCEQGASMVQEARVRQADSVVMAAARQMHSELLSTKHAVEDELVAFVLDCSRCGRRVHWVPGDGCALGHWAHSEPAPTDHGPRLPHYT
jgi:hypothetical protein